MIKTLIIEDEKRIADQFRDLLQKTSETEIVGSVATVQEGVEFLKNNGSPDLIFSDVQLPDGLSFEIFNQVPVKSPIVFVTGYDKFITDAFEHNGIDYLLKPVDEKDLTKTIAKYRNLETHFSGKALNRLFAPKHKRRLLVRKGTEFIPLLTEDIVLIYTEKKLVHVVARDRKKYLADKNLGELEAELDNTAFFRANRQYIVNIDYIKSYKTVDKGKLKINLILADLNYNIVVSQETAADFRKWISGL